MQNPMVIMNFSIFDWKYSFFCKLGPKNQNCQFKVKFGTQTNFNMQNSMVVFTFSVLERKHPFSANLVQKIMIISWSWNLVSTIIFITFWDFFMFYLIFLSPQVKQCAIIFYKHGIYELPHELPNDLRK